MKPNIYKRLATIVGLNRIGPSHVDMFVGLIVQPVASVKVVWLSHHQGRAERRRAKTRPDRHRGNSIQPGIALAMVCAVLGHLRYHGETFSIERRKVMRALGTMILTLPNAVPAWCETEELAAQHDWFLARRFQTSEPGLSASTTGRDFARLRRRSIGLLGHRLGTGGNGAGALKTARPDLKIIAAEPEQAALLSGGDWSHKIQVGRLTIPDVLDRDVPDKDRARKRR